MGEDCAFQTKWDTASPGLQPDEFVITHTDIRSVPEALFILFFFPYGQLGRSEHFQLESTQSDVL